LVLQEDAPRYTPSKKVSIRDSSFFSVGATTIEKTIYALYEWSVKESIQQTAYELSLDENTVGGMFKSFRGIASQIVKTHLTGAIGRHGATCEIDECQLGRRKHHRGRAPTEVWVFGGVVRGSNPQQCFLRIVRKRNRNTLTPLIQTCISQEAKLISDDWGAYRRLRQIGYNHHIVRHCDNFVDPQDPSIHTQNIENLWRCLRRFLATKGSYTRRNLQGYLDEFVFRKHYIDPFETIIAYLNG